MSITRAQQARQMYKKGTKKPAIQGGGPNYLGKQPEVTVPKKWKSSPDHPNTELAYITEPEKQVLIALNMHGGLEDGKPNKGPKGVMSLQGDMGTIGGGGSKNGNNNNNNNDGGGDARSNYIANYVSKGIVKGGGPKIGTDADGNPVYADAKLTKSQINKAKDFRETQKFKRAFTTKTLFDKVPSTLKILSRLIPGNLKYRQEFLANNPQLLEYFNSLTEEEQKSGKLMSALKGITNLDGKTYEDFLAFDKGAPGLKYSGNVGGLEKFVKEDGTFGYTDVGNRDGADNILLPQTIAQAPSITEQELEYINPLSLLTPRIAGTRFLGTEFEDEDEDKSFDLRLAKGGRIGLENGGISLQEAKDMAPKGEFLAYINKKEANMLKEAGGSGIMTNAGIPSFVEYGGQSGFEGAKSTGSVQGDVDRGGGDGPKGPPTNVGGGGSKPKPGSGRVNNPNRFGPKNLSFFDKIKAHSTNNAKLEQAYKDGLISSDEYNVLGGYDVKQTLGFGPVKTAAASTAYNLVQSALGPKFSRGNQPLFDGAADVGRNTFGSTLKPDSALAQTYDTIMNTYKKGGRAELAGGGIASLEDMDREAFLLGGIAKGLKKAVRGVKKIAKSPLGKAALGLAAFKFGPAIFGKGSFNPFLRTVAGDTAFSPLGSILSKAGLVSKAGLPTFKGGIALTSILPLLTGKTDEEKDDILKEY